MTKLLIEKKEDSSYIVRLGESARTKEEYSDLFIGLGSTITAAINNLFGKLLRELRSQEEFPLFLFRLIKDIMMGKLEEENGNNVYLDPKEISLYTTASAYGVPFWADDNYLYQGSNK